MLKGIWKDPVWSKVIATGILAVIASFGTYIFGVWPEIGSAFSQAWSFTIASTSTPNWLLALMAIPCILLIFSVLVEIKGKISASEPTKTWKSYTRDNFLGLLWSWRYTGNKIYNLHSLCPQCEYQILPKDVSAFSAVPRYDYSCEDCGYSAGSFEGYPEDLLQKVQLKIQKGLRTGQWESRQQA
ncbi:hypothetical protein ACG1BZ_06285 [Microbulbifer sp. CNSA002]|uniref:hypothetical protein n=1 Tax=Microbulbifer sp. CNSA002 TaxID=3373604 RepID=UPI0039B58585